MKKIALMTAVFCAVAMIGTSAFAASPLRAVGVEAGYVSPDIEAGPDMNTWVAGVFLDFGLPATNMSDGEGTSEMSFSDWSVGANVKWTIPTAGMISPFLAAGAAAHMLNVSQDALNLDEGETRFGFQAGAGAKVGVSQSASIITSGWYHIVEDVNQWSLRAGLAWSI